MIGKRPWWSGEGERSVPCEEGKRRMNECG